MPKHERKTQPVEASKQPESTRRTSHLDLLRRGLRILSNGSERQMTFLELDFDISYGVANRYAVVIGGGETTDYDQFVLDILKIPEEMGGELRQMRSKTEETLPSDNTYLQKMFRTTNPDMKVPVYINEYRFQPKNGFSISLIREMLQYPGTKGKPMTFRVRGELNTENWANS